MEPIKLQSLLGPRGPETVSTPFTTGAADQTSFKATQRLTQLIAPTTKELSSATRPTTEYVAASVGSFSKAQKEYAKAIGSEGAASALKASNAFAATLKGASYASYTIAQPLNFVAALTGIPVKGTSPSLIGRSSYGLNALALQLRDIAATLFMMVTGYKIYENIKWLGLSKEEFYEKIQLPAVDQIDKKYCNSDYLKNLVYGYFEEKVGEILKEGSKQGLKAVLNKEGLKANLDAKIKELLDDESSEFIKDKDSWEICQGKRRDPVEAFGLYIELMLARQSHQKEIKRVFGKDGLALIKQGSADLYAQAMGVCKRRLTLDTLNFVLGIGVMSAIAFTVSASLALPLLVKVSKDSPTFEYIQFILKAFVLGSVVFTPHGLVSLLTFNLGLSFYSLFKGGVSKLPFMSSKGMENYTRWDKLLIQFNIILSALSIFSTGFMGLYVDVPALTTAALASTQLPWIGLNMYGLSEIWKREEIKREEIREQIKKIVREKDEIKEHIKKICDGGRGKSLSDLFEEYCFDSIEKAYLETAEIRQIKGFESDAGIKQILKAEYSMKCENDEKILSRIEFIRRYSDKKTKLKQLAMSWLHRYDFSLVRKACLTTPDIKEIEGFKTDEEIEDQLEVYRDEHEDRKKLHLREGVASSFKALEDAGFITVDKTLANLNRGGGKSLSEIRKETREQIKREIASINAGNCSQIFQKLLQRYDNTVISEVVVSQKDQINDFQVVIEEFDRCKRI